jgi:hypothetical protein
MLEVELASLLMAGGVTQLGVLIASALVPFRLNWHRELAPLARLHRQLYWVYGGYIVLSIVAFALITLLNARELAAGGGLARGFCGYVAVFWGVRLCLQPVFDVKEHLTEWWLRLGYHALTLLFVFLAAVYAWAAIHPEKG